MCLSTFVWSLGAGRSYSFMFSHSLMSPNMSQIFTSRLVTLCLSLALEVGDWPTNPHLVSSLNRLSSDMTITPTMKYCFHQEEGVSRPTLSGFHVANSIESSTRLMFHDTTISVAGYSTQLVKRTTGGSYCSYSFM